MRAIFSLIFGLVFVLTAAVGSAAELSPQEKLLLGAMTLRSSDPYAREVGSGEAIGALIKSGHVKRKPFQRADYVDYWPLKKSVTFFGHKVLLLEEEYLVEFIGCCVNVGIGMVIEETGDTSELESFAKANQCRKEGEDYWKGSLENAGLKPKAGVKYSYISCREKDGPL
jgi:hypothetical protein